MCRKSNTCSGFVFLFPVSQSTGCNPASEALNIFTTVALRLDFSQYGKAEVG